METDDRVPYARRDIQTFFNRSGGTRVSKHLRGLVEEGWLAVAERTRGRIPHTYCRGPLLRRRTLLREDWQSIATSLWGHGGLLAEFRGSPALGVGCLGPCRVLVLAAVVYDPPVPASVLRGYLAAWMSRQTVWAATKTLMDVGLIELADGGFVPVEGWREILDRLVAELPAGADRQQRISQRVLLDRETFTELLRSGAVSPEERAQLLARPCVRCGARSTEIEHFPPRKFLALNHRYLVWAICSACNNHLSIFIRGLPKPPTPASQVVVAADGADRVEWLRASLEVGLRRLYAAADVGNQDEALGAIRRSLALWRALSLEGPIPSQRTRSDRSRTRRTKTGRSPTAGSQSRLPY
ncbi:hypothetical protein JYT54_00875 [bacterium AH-315-A03]|nr:hypothetical protein [bacterium AH-315-A03]